MFEKIREIKRNICRWINNKYYTNEKIYHYLESGTYSTVDRDNNGITVEFELIEQFDDEDKKIFEEAEKGSSEIDPIGITMIFDKNDIYIAYSLKAIKDELFYLNPLIVWSEIMDIGKHEGFHCKQYIYIIKKGGMEGVSKIREYMQNVDYENNIIELGAYAYQFWNKEQDFEKELDPIINGEYNLDNSDDKKTIDNNTVPAFA